MSKTDGYRSHLETLDDWVPYLCQESGLPGPRGNLELAHAVAIAGNRQRFEELLGYGQDPSQTNSPDEFLLFCGILGLGQLAAAGDESQFALLRRYAGDARWRIREGVATALQLVGDGDMDRLLVELEVWQHGTWLERRAVVAALAEPRLLRRADDAVRVVTAFDEITTAIASATQRGDDYRVLRQALGYGWSVVVAGQPIAGKAAFERWLERAERSADRDLRWVMRENLKKKRLIAVDSRWVSEWATRLG